MKKLALAILLLFCLGCEAGMLVNVKDIQSYGTEAFVDFKDGETKMTVTTLGQIR